MDLIDHDRMSCSVVSVLSKKQNNLFLIREIQEEVQVEVVFILMVQFDLLAKRLRRLMNLELHGRDVFSFVSVWCCSTVKQII